jgi:hypothetical protein
MNPIFILAALIPACGEPEDTGFGDEIPDIRGHFQVHVEGAAGCEGSYSYLTDWAIGPLTITGGGPNQLTYTFVSDMVFQGHVDAAWSFQLSGSATWGTANLSVYEDGMVTLEDQRYLMEGEFEVLVDDDEFLTNDCTITAKARHTQISD